MVSARTDRTLLRARTGRLDDLEPLVDVSTLAAYLGVSVGYVYEHSDELGARRLGSGPKARLRFSIVEVDLRLTACPLGRESQDAAGGMVEPKRRAHRGSSMGSTVELLPIRGNRFAS
jgi:hypothetical protein